MKLMIRYLRPFFKAMLLGLSIKITGTVLELVLPYILSYILENVVEKQKVTLVLAWGGIMILCALLACVFNIVANRMAARVARNFSERVRKISLQKRYACPHRKRTSSA